MSELADTHQPLRLADGRLVDPSNGKVFKEKSLVEVPRNDEIKLRHAAIQRRLADLPLPVDRMNGLSVILTYSFFGLSNEDIAIAVGLDVEQIAAIKMSDGYSQLHSTVVEAIKSSDTNDIRAAIHANARLSVTKAKELLEDGSEGTKVAMIRDMLDRDGHRPIDVVEHRVKMDGGLTIEVIRKDENKELPAIDVTFKEE